MYKVQGIIIRSVEYKEKDKLLTFFTPKGLLLASARGVRSPKSKLKQYCGEMTFGDFSFTEKGETKILSGAEIYDSFYSVWGEYEKFAAITYCFELTEKCFSNEEETSSEFIFLIKLMKEIVYGQSLPCSTALRYAVFCAESFGVDYSQIENYDKESFDVISAFSKCSAEDCGIMPYTEATVKKALALLNNVFKNFLSFKSSTIKIILK